MKASVIGLLLVVAIGVGLATDYAVVVGIDEYMYLWELKYAEKDAEEIGMLLRELGYQARILTGEVSEGAILESIRYYAIGARERDTLVFYFSGHGAPGTDETERGLLTTYSHPERGTYKVSQSELREALSEFPGKKIVVLDACFQGGGSRSEMVRMDREMNAKLSETVDFLVTSSAGNQEASDGFWLGNQYKENGVVGYYLQEALRGEADKIRDRTLTSEELNRYFMNYASYAAETNGQNLEVKYRQGNEELFYLWEEEKIPEGMVLVESGSFDMGNTRGDSETDGDETVHRVELTYDYLIGKYEVTFADYDAYCAATGASKPSDSGWGRGSRPVKNVSWWDAIGYCNWLSEKEGLAKAYDSKGNLLDEAGKVTRDITKVEGYRLPTEAEWEYAARGGHKRVQDNKCGEVTT